MKKKKRERSLKTWSAQKFIRAKRKQEAKARKIKMNFKVSKRERVLARGWVDKKDLIKKPNYSYRELIFTDEAIELNDPIKVKIVVDDNE